MMGPGARRCYPGSAWVALGVLLLRLGAAEDVGKLLAAGDAAMASGHFAAAINRYTTALDTDPDAALIYNKRATAYNSQGNLQKALQDYDRAIQLRPESKAARLSRAKLHRTVCNLEAAEVDASGILEEAPGNRAAESELSKISTTRKLLQEAGSESNKEARRGVLSKLLDIAPFCTAAKLIQASLLLEDKDYGGVVLLTGQVLKQQPASIPALLLRGNAYVSLGDLEVGKRHYSEALRSDPDHKEAKGLFKTLKKLLRHRQQAEAAKQAGRDEEAEGEFLAALGVGPPPDIISSALWLELCRVRLKLRKPEAAAEACGTAHAMLPEEEDAVVLKIRALILSGEHGAAVQEAGAARRQFGNSQQVFEVLREAEKAQKMAERKDYYKELNITQGAGALEIKRAYRELARKFHPDKAAAAGITTEAAHARFTEISEAYEVLSNEERRAAYDRGDDLREGQAGFEGNGFPEGFMGGFQGQQFTFHFG